MRLPLAVERCNRAQCMAHHRGGAKFPRRQLGRADSEVHHERPVESGRVGGWEPSQCRSGTPIADDQSGKCSGPPIEGARGAANASRAV
jgi:hypothetical protein